MWTFDAGRTALGTRQSGCRPCERSAAALRFLAPGAYPRLMTDDNSNRPTADVRELEAQVRRWLGGPAAKRLPFVVCSFTARPHALALLPPPKLGDPIQELRMALERDLETLRP